MEKITHTKNKRGGITTTNRRSDGNKTVRHTDRNGNYAGSEFHGKDGSKRRENKKGYTY